MSPATEQGPIATATAGLVAWLSDVSGADVDTAPPGDGGGPALSVWPLELLPEREVRSANPAPLRFLVRHLVSGSGPVAESTALLDRVLVAAVAAGSPEVSVQPQVPEVWLALGARPRPALVFDVPAAVARPQIVPVRVRAPLQLREGVVRAVAGRVLGPDDVPLAGIRLEVADTGASTYTGTDGAFLLAAIPDGTPVRLRLSGRGLHRRAELAADAPTHDVVLRFDLEEA